MNKLIVNKAISVGGNNMLTLPKLDIIKIPQWVGGNATIIVNTTPKLDRYNNHCCFGVVLTIIAYNLIPMGNDFS